MMLGFRLTGSTKDPSPLVNACSKFLFLDDPEAVKQKKNPNLKSDTKLINLLRQAIEATEDNEGWAALGSVGSNISNRTSFDCRNYGFKNLSSLFKEVDLFELKLGQGRTYMVKDARKCKKSEQVQS
jgi:hypothetical protein